ncbi:MAG: hypothetical protein K2V38_16625, partial [Gemmataceae bacterium]|nr:hypothetical protein [Gemmataceae bacterium]
PRAPEVGVREVRGAAARRADALLKDEIGHTGCFSTTGGSLHPERGPHLVGVHNLSVLLE